MNGAWASGFDRRAIWPAPSWNIRAIGWSAGKLLFGVSPCFANCSTHRGWVVISLSALPQTYKSIKAAAAAVLSYRCHMMKAESAALLAESWRSFR
jgi:hypothetical protein